MKAKLDDLELVLVHHLKDNPSNPVEDMRTISRVWTGDRRSIVEHKIPGKEASVFQDLGRHSLRFALAGKLSGVQSKAVAEGLWRKFHQGHALPFTTDIPTLSEVKKVVIEGLESEHSAGRVGQFTYWLVLREFKEPPKKKAQAPNQSDKAAKKAKDETNKAKGAVNYVTGKVLDSENNPVSSADVIISGDKGDMKVKTDDNGVFRRDNMDPGKYKVRVDAPGYEDEKDVEVKSANDSGGGTEEGSAGGRESEQGSGASSEGGAEGPSGEKNEEMDQSETASSGGTTEASSD